MCPRASNGIGWIDGRYRSIRALLVPAPRGARNFEVTEIRIS